MSTVTIYGIANCDTIKRARRWLDRKKIEYIFHDYRKQGLDAEQLRQWVDVLGWQALLNKRGTTWRKLADDIKDNIDQASAIDIMLENPAIIKRPLLVKGNEMLLGFSDSQYRALFG